MASGNFLDLVILRPTMQSDNLIDCEAEYHIPVSISENNRK